MAANGADCVAILQRCRASMKPAARLVLVEFLVNPQEGQS